MWLESSLHQGGFLERTEAEKTNQIKGSNDESDRLYPHGFFVVLSVGERRQRSSVVKSRQTIWIMPGKESQKCTANISIFAVSELQRR